MPADQADLARARRRVNPRGVGADAFLTARLRPRCFRWWLVWLCLVVGLTGCTPSSPPLPSPVLDRPSSTTGDDRTRSAQQAVDGWLRSGRNGDLTRGNEYVSLQDPAFAATADVLRHNLARLPLATLTAVVGPQRRELSGARAHLFGADGWVQPVRIRWSLTGESGTAEHHVWMVFVTRAGQVRVAGTEGDHAANLPLPLWWLERVEVRQSKNSIVLIGEASRTPLSAAQWNRLLDSALSEVTARVDRGKASTRTVVLELPSRLEGFERVLGASPDVYTRLAAVAWPEGPDPGTAAVRIVVNPAVAEKLPSRSLAIVATHEITHLVTRSVDSPAPAWLVEGFADWVAYEVWPEEREAAVAPAVRTVLADGAPDAFPADEQFVPGTEGLEVSYALAWLSCRFIAETYSPQALNDLYDLVDGGSSFDTATRSLLGVDQNVLRMRWQDYLTEMSERG